MLRVPCRAAPRSPERLSGIEQHGALLGRPGARSTVVEFGDLHRFARTTRPRWWPREASTAAEQNRLWNFVELLYRNQGTENSGYVTPAFLRAIAKGAGVPDLARLERDRHAKHWAAPMARTETQARAHGFSGTPSLRCSRPRRRKGAWDAALSRGDRSGAGRSGLAAGQLVRPSQEGL